MKQVVLSLSSTERISSDVEVHSVLISAGAYEERVDHVSALQKNIYEKTKEGTFLHLYE
jgi:hypothetical protein